MVPDPIEDGGREEGRDVAVEDVGEANDIGEVARDGTREGGGDAVLIGWDIKLVGVSGGACRWSRRMKF